MSGYPSGAKRKNDERRESLFMPLIRLLGRLLRFSFRALFVIPLRWAWRATVWSVKAPLRALGWLLHELNVLINGPMPEFETAREREIYRRIKRHYRRRNRFITHLFVFIFGNALWWISHWSGGFYEYPYRPISPYVAFTAMWVFILLFHYIRLRMGEAEDTALEAALEREYERESRSQPMYYEETETWYGDEARYPHLADEPGFEGRVRDLPKAKRRSSYS